MRTPKTTMALGTCCACGTNYQVTTIVTLPHPSPTPGHGWGCVVCDLPANGATAVLCERCSTRLARVKDPMKILRWICTGRPADGGRTPVEQMSQEHFGHNQKRHAVERNGNGIV